MKAAVYSGNNIRIKDVERPVPKDNEVLVRIHATTICAADYRVRGALPFVGWLLALWRRGKPIILGMELAGTVESAGSAVTRFRVGDLVLGGTGFQLGSHAEYASVQERGIEIKPPNM